jgi:hypothetical protein
VKVRVVAHFNSLIFPKEIDKAKIQPLCLLNISQSISTFWKIEIVSQLLDFVLKPHQSLLVI